MEEEKKSSETLENVKKQVEKELKSIVETGIKSDNIEKLYKLIDVHKDILNEEYWKEKIDMYRDGNYGEYSEGSFGRRGVKGTGRGRYRGGRGSGRYRGEEMMDEMAYHYGNYSESGQYGAENEAMESLNALMESATEYFKHLKENAGSQEEIKMIEHYLKKMGQM